MPPSPLDTATQLRSEMRQRTQQAIEALLKRLAPDLERLEADDLAAILTVELVRCVEDAQGEALRELAELAQAGNPP